MGRWRTMVLVGLGVAACGGEPLGLTQAAEILPDPGSSSEGVPAGEPVGGSTGGGWSGGEGEDSGDGGGWGRGEGGGSSSDQPEPEPDPVEPEPEPGPDGNAVTSGSRLHRRRLASADSPASHGGLWDSELEVPCSFERASDGERRCMPDAHGSMMFSDAECTQPVIASYWSCVEPDLRYARRYLGESDCDRTIEAYAALDGETPAEMPVFSDWTGECVAEGIEMAVSAQPIADGELVRATVVEQPRADWMSMRILQADDGAALPVEVFDVGRAERCRPDTESGRCVPVSAGGFSPWNTRYDASCEQRVVSVDACGGSTLRGRESACDPWSFYEHGDEIGLDEVSVLDEDNVCEAAQGVYSTHVTVGPVIPVETFPAVETVMVGEGRIREQRLVDAAGNSLAANGWGRTLYDTDLGERCAPRLMADGAIRCLPPALQVSSLPLFADDACTQRVVSYSTDCEVTTTPGYAVESGGCGVAASIYVLGDELDITEAYWEAGGCSLAKHLPDNTVFFPVAEELPTEAFVELDYVVDGP